MLIFQFPVALSGSQIGVRFLCSTHQKRSLKCLRIAEIILNEWQEK